GAPLHFRTKGLAQPHDVDLVPLYRIVAERYTVYWNLYSPAVWAKRQAEVAADTAAKAARRAELERRTLDIVVIDDAGSETAHALRSENAREGYFEGRRTREAPNGWFSYDLNVRPDAPVTLVSGYRGSEGRKRVFDILVDGQKVATETLEYHPTEQLDREYLLPEGLTRGKQRVTVTFRAVDGATAGAVIDVRTVVVREERR
ncbi:MAG TPA: DUF6805 domain-containing protein, partial [Vicinamibacterales bacterium]|nr:DUF6805 domain-containing protein [Vicinamibacterales bacterium]